MISLKPHIIIPEILPAGENNFSTGAYIIINEALKKPPHLSLCAEGRVFNLGVQGLQADIPVSRLIRSIRIKKSHALFVHLDTNLCVFNNRLYVEAKTNLLQFTSLEPGITTCLSPIKSFCEKIFEMNIEDIHLIFDL